jgi:hypothetical protein
MAFDGTEGISIDHTTAAAWTKTYRQTHQDEQLGRFFGRDILLSILAQKDCQGIRFYYGLNELEPQLLAVGADSEENDQLDEDCIVADDSAISPPRSGCLNILNS